MFTPEGYWSWTETVEAVSGWTRDLIIATRYPSSARQMAEWKPHQVEHFLHQKLLEDGYVENGAELGFALGVSELWVLANFLDTFDVLLCSPTGMPMRCPPPIVAHGDALDWWRFPGSVDKFGSGETHGYLHNFRNGNMRLADAQARFCAIDYSSGLIKLKPNSIRLFWASSYGHGSSEEGEVRAFVSEQVRPFVGCSVCWNPKDIPETRGEIFKALGFSDIDWKQVGIETSNDNGAKQPGGNVLECLLSAFPEGKRGATWEIVERTVGYSRRSIVRALKQNGQWEEWSNGGGQT